MTDKEEILGAIQSLRREFQTEISGLGVRLTHVESKVDKLDRDVERYGDRLETYQKASDRLISLVTTIIAGASAVVILAPLSRVVADFSAKALGII